MSGAKYCANCGLPLPGNAFARHCPDCLQELAQRFETASANAAEPVFDVHNRQWGDYVLGRQLGAGGMGVVYAARQVSLDRPVAIKLIRDVHMASATQRCRFTIEAEAAARLEHPNIVRIHDVGEINGHPFFSMELVTGDSLSAKIARGEYAVIQSADNLRTRADTIQGTIAQLMLKTARAVHHAHERGVLHRDLKPGNILMDQKGEPRLTDFGLAKLLEHSLADPVRPALTSMGEFPGTPSYMAPEQVSGKEITCSTDIYGLGAVLYELLTGWPPFEGATPLETFQQITRQKPCKPRSLNARIHPDLETICLKCLEKDPRHRYSSAEAMAVDLEAWLAGRPIQARPAGKVRRTREWIRANPLGATLITTLCAGLMIALGLLAIVSEQRKEIERDRDQTFDEGMQKVSLIWKDPDTREITISARELAILAGQSPRTVAQARQRLCFGVSADNEPSGLAQRYAGWLSRLQARISEQQGVPTVFELKLLKRFNPDELSLARGEADLMAVSAVDYLKAKKLASGVTLLAREQLIREAVIFAHTNIPARSLPELVSQRIVFPDPDLSITVWAKAHLFEAGLQAAHFQSCTNILDQGSETGQIVVSFAETAIRVLKGVDTVGVTFRERFERYKHFGLVMLDVYPETPNVLVARQGLDPALLQAIQTIVAEMQSDIEDNSDYEEGFGNMVPVEDTYFAPLREAVRAAEAFDAPAQQTVIPHPVPTAVEVAKP